MAAPTEAEARAALQAVCGTFALAQAERPLPKVAEVVVAGGIVLLAEYLIGRPPKGSSEVQMIARGAERAVEALRTFDNADLYLHDGGYSRLLVRPLDTPPLLLSGVSLDGPKARWAAIACHQPKGV